MENHTNLSCFGTSIDGRWECHAPELPELPPLFYNIENDEFNAPHTSRPWGSWSMSPEQLMTLCEEFWELQARCPFDSPTRDHQRPFFPSDNALKKPLKPLKPLKTLPQRSQPLILTGSLPAPAGPAMMSRTRPKPVQPAAPAAREIVDLTVVPDSEDEEEEDEREKRRPYGIRRVSFLSSILRRTAPPTEAMKTQFMRLRMTKDGKLVEYPSQKK